jgi:peptidoglycan/xylan/chitin deacetylase (PgdA/CDA1 family)
MRRKYLAALTAAAGLTAAMPAVAGAATAADVTGPTVTITAPTATAYAQNASVVAKFTCADPSGVASCVGTVANGAKLATATAGSFTFTVKATDKKGNGTVKNVAYTVKAPAGTTPAACSAGYAALTIDDGPTTMTRTYVDTLIANGAKATFFDVGVNMKARPTDAQYTATKGMPVGNHTMTHPDLLTWSDEGVFWEIQDQLDLATSLGIKETLFRVPFGSGDGRTWDDAFNAGMMETSWTIDTDDWADGKAAAQIVASASAAKNQDIVLLHDGYAATLAALPQIIANWKAKGLCAGVLQQPNWDTPITSEYGFPIFEKVVAP